MYRPNVKSILAIPHFVALRAIASVEELIFDYGFNERNGNSVNSHNNSQDISCNDIIILLNNTNFNIIIIMLYYI